MHNHLDLLFTLHQWWITTSLHYCCFRISVTFILQSRLGSDLMTFPFRAKFLQGLFLFTNTFSFCKDFLFAKTFSFYKYVFFLQIRFLFTNTFSFCKDFFFLQIRFLFANFLFFKLFKATLKTFIVKFILQRGFISKTKMPKKNQQNCLPRRRFFHVLIKHKRKGSSLVHALIKRKKGSFFIRQLHFCLASGNRARAEVG